jgi:thioredoxin-related protein
VKQILIIFSIFFIIACNNNSENRVQHTKKGNQVGDNKIKIEDLVFEKGNGKLKFHFKNEKILLFSNGGDLVKSQIEELKKGGYKFYVIKNDELITLFKIHKFPTIIITDGKNEKRYEGFIPNEVFKYEIKD